MNPRPAPLAVRVLAGLFIGAGVLHFVRPAIYLGIMPAYLPQPLLLIYLSGVAEVLGGVGLLLPRWRRVAGWWLILTLLAILPANYEMLQRWQARGASPLAIAGLWLRLPVQGLLMWWVWRVSQRPPASVGAPAA